MAAAHGERAGVLGHQLARGAQHLFGGEGLGHEFDMGEGRRQAFATIAGQEDEGRCGLGEAGGNLLDGVAAQIAIKEGGIEMLQAAANVRVEQIARWLAYGLENAMGKVLKKELR